jgi:ribosomal protein S12 methylthiotransferase
LKSNPYKKKADSRINVITLGCSKNVFDSEQLMGQIKHNGAEVVHEQTAKKQDIVIINTCGFIDKAKQESIDTILEYQEAKASGKISKLIVMGCLSERYADDLRPEFPEVDGFYGTRNIPDILSDLGLDYKHELLGERMLTNPSHYAYLKIAEGCNRPCSFCAIPLMRGQHVSTSIDDLVKEAKYLASNGTKELILIAQELTYYGLDLYNKRMLPELLDALQEVEGIEWIRLQYAYPAQFPMEIIDAMARNSKVCHYLDMPLQHGADNMLKAMRRGITRRKTEELITDIRNKIPDITLRTTILVGHPGETQDDFDELCTFIKLMEFDRLGVFTYSHEEQTHAGTLEDDVPEEVKEERSEIIMDIQREISLKKNIQKVGKSFKVLIDRKEPEYWIGRTSADSAEVDNEVLIKADNQYLRVGDFVDVKIIDALEYDLFAEVIPL